TLGRKNVKWSGTLTIGTSSLFNLPFTNLANPTTDFSALQQYSGFGGGLTGGYILLYAESECVQTKYGHEQGIVALLLAGSGFGAGFAVNASSTRFEIETPGLFVPSPFALLGGFLWGGSVGRRQCESRPRLRIFQHRIWHWRISGANISCPWWHN